MRKAWRVSQKEISNLFGLQAAPFWRMKREEGTLNPRRILLQTTENIRFMGKLISNYHSVKDNLNRQKIVLILPSITIGYNRNYFWFFRKCLCLQKVVLYYNVQMHFLSILWRYFISDDNSNSAGLLAWISWNRYLRCCPVFGKLIGLKRKTNCYNFKGLNSRFWPEKQT